MWSNSKPVTFSIAILFLVMASRLPLNQRGSVKNDVLEHFAKFTRKHLWQSLFFNKVAGQTLAQEFSYEFCEISKNTFYTEHLWTTASV